MGAPTRRPGLSQRIGAVEAIRTRVISIGLKVVGLAPSGRTDPAFARLLPLDYYVRKRRKYRAVWQRETTPCQSHHLFGCDWYSGLD